MQPDTQIGKHDQAIIRKHEGRPGPAVTVYEGGSKGPQKGRRKKARAVGRDVAEDMQGNPEHFPYRSLENEVQNGKHKRKYYQTVAYAVER